MAKKSLKEIRTIVEDVKKLFGGKVIELDYSTPFQLLVAVMLSAQTTDKQVNKITPPFFMRVKEAKDMEAMELPEVEEYFKYVNYYRNKSKHIKLTAEKLAREFGGIIPNDLKVLQTFPGIGVKTAKVVLSVLYSEPHVWVDTHIHRVTNRTGMVKTKTPEETDRVISDFPEDIRREMHHAFVLFGRYHCTAIKPKCPTCPIQDRCDYFKKMNRVP